MNENLKAWLGINLQDTLLNLSFIPVLIGFFVNNTPLMLICFAIGFLLSVAGVVVYFTRNNPKVGKTTAQLNKWLSVIMVLVMWLIMGVKAVVSLLAGK